MPPFGPWPGQQPGAAPTTNGPAVFATLSGQLLAGEGGTSFTFLSDPGFEAATISNDAVDPVRYPSPARTVKTLRGCAPLGTLLIPVTFTLYKNGAATAMTCTIAASQPAGTKAVDSAHAIVFAAGDDFDVRASVGGLLASALPVSASLEGT